MDPVIARKTWRTLEPYHGLVYFAPEPAERYARLGVEGRAAYFPSRAAAMGAVSAEVVVATFYNFCPSLPRSAIPAGWAAAAPEAWLDARLQGVDDALRRAIDDAGVAADDIERAVTLATAAADAAAERVEGRPLAAAHAALPRADEPHLALWQAITVLREHRGDGHVACLVDGGVDPCGALVLHAATGAVPRETLQSTRGWSDGEWGAAVERLATRGWIDADGAFTDEGRAAREAIEQRTDELAVEPWSAIGEAACEELRALVRPVSKSISESSAFGFRGRR